MDSFRAGADTAEHFYTQEQPEACTSGRDATMADGEEADMMDAFRAAAEAVKAQREEAAMCTEDRIYKHVKAWCKEWESDLDRRPAEIRESGAGGDGRQVYAWQSTRFRRPEQIHRAVLAIVAMLCCLWHRRSLRTYTARRNVVQRRLPSMRRRQPSSAGCALWACWVFLCCVFLSPKPLPLPCAQACRRSRSSSRRCRSHSTIVTSVMPMAAAQACRRRRSSSRR